MIDAQQVYAKGAGETRNVGVSFDPVLEPGESLDGTPVVAELSGDGQLVFAGEAVTTEEQEVLGEPVAAGRAVVFVVAGGTAGTRYRFGVTASTTAGQVVQCAGTLVVV